MAKLDRLLSLVHALVDEPEGLTLDDMAQHVGVNRRTAERMRNVIMMHFDLEPISEGRIKRWRIAGKLGRMFTKPTPTELAALQAEVDGYRRSSQHAQADVLASLLHKIRGALDGPTRTRTAPDVEALTRAQRIFIPAGPGIPISPETLSVAQQTIMAGMMLEFDYRAEGKEEAEWRRVIPYGLVHGAISYLIGKLPEREAPPVFYRLDRMTGVKVSDRTGIIPADFDIDQWMSQSFGIWRGEKYDVELHVAPHAASLAKQWRFHLQQFIENNPDGSLTIKFRSGGLQELASHIITWGDGLSAISPPQLIDEIMKIISRNNYASRNKYK
jgi:predicted DNA-binding transcriptional regulator YafY